jgi:transcriptional regulator GlxA family with amidase domain
MTEATDQPISFEGRRAAARLHGALKVLVSMHRRMTLPQAMTFLHVAWEEGLTVSALATKVGVKPHTVSNIFGTSGPPTDAKSRAWA